MSFLSHDNVRQGSLEFLEQLSILNSSCSCEQSRKKVDFLGTNYLFRGGNLEQNQVDMGGTLKLTDRRSKEKKNCAR